MEQTAFHSAQAEEYRQTGHLSHKVINLIHGGKTPGMMAARMRLYTFQGKVPNLSQRRVRLLGLYLSTLSLAMGLMWALVDGDGLCWHDRISHTYLSPYP